MKFLINYIIDLSVGIIHVSGIIFMLLLPLAKEAETNQPVMMYGYNNLVDNIGVFPSYATLVIVIIAITIVGSIFRKLYKVEDINNDRKDI